MIVVVLVVVGAGLRPNLLEARDVATSSSCQAIYFKQLIEEGAFNA